MTKKKISAFERDIWISDILPSAAKRACSGRDDHTHNLRIALRNARRLGIGKRAIAKAVRKGCK
jgi:hypothetical protein